MPINDEPLFFFCYIFTHITVSHKNDDIDARISEHI